MMSAVEPVRELVECIGKQARILRVNERQQAVAELQQAVTSLRMTVIAQTARSESSSSAAAISPQPARTYSLNGSAFSDVRHRARYT